MSKLMSASVRNITIPHTQTKNRREVLQFEICKCEGSAAP